MSQTQIVCCILLLYLAPEVSAIGCFVCSSINGSETDCEDTFNNTGKFYKPECQAGRKSRSGVFPGTGCIKMKAELGSYTVLVRDCTVDNGDTTSDTEMGRESHCWLVKRINFNDIDMYGCSLACHTDGCNDATAVYWSYIVFVLNVFVWFVLVAF